MNAAVFRYLSVLPLCACLAGPVRAWTPYHAHFSGGASAPVHYVHQKLDMPPSFHERHRQTLLDHYTLCRKAKEAAALIGEPVESYQPLPELPAHPWVGDVEIYYGAGRAVAVTTFTHYVIDLQKDRRKPHWKGDCGLLKSTTRTISMHDPTRACKIETSALSSRLEVRCSPRAGDAEHRYRASLPDEALGVAGPTGEIRTIAGRRCRVFGALKELETCIEKRDRLGGQTMPLLSPVNSIEAGLLLLSNLGGLRYAAQRVELDIQVGERLFQIPENGAALSVLPPFPVDHR